MLQIENLVTSYGIIKALNGISLQVHEGELVALLGANGAGKSTLVKSILGVATVNSGAIRFLGEDISKMSPSEIIAKGIAVVPEGRRLFPDMTVMENLELGAYAGGNIKRFDELTQSVFSFFPRLKERKKQYAGTMSGGEQQMLAFGRAMMATPKLLLLDEPSMGLSPVIIEEVYSAIQKINKQGTTILLIEQNAMIALEVCKRAYVLNTGNIVNEDTAENILGNDSLLKAYLATE